MYCTSVSTAVATHNVARMTERQENENTGMKVSVLQYPTEQVNKTPQRLLHVIALALDMNPECYKMKTRVRSIVELRFIASILLRQYFPALTLHQIAAYYGGQDHTSVMNAISRAHNLIYVRDTDFIKKYNTVLKSVSAWIRRDA